MPDAQFFLQAEYTLVDRAVATPAGVLGQRTGQPRRAGAGRAGDQHTVDIPSAAAICWCDILASNFRRNTSFILRILILDTGTLSPDKKLAAYSVSCYMRSIISVLYDTIPVS